MLLSACSAKRPAQPPLTFRTALLQSGGCSFTAAITADSSLLIFPYLLFLFIPIPFTYRRGSPHSYCVGIQMP